MSGMRVLVQKLEPTSCLQAPLTFVRRQATQAVQWIYTVVSKAVLSRPIASALSFAIRARREQQTRNLSPPRSLSCTARLRLLWPSYIFSPSPTPGWPSMPSNDVHNPGLIICDRDWSNIRDSECRLAPRKLDPENRRHPPSYAIIASSSLLKRAASHVQFLRISRLSYREPKAPVPQKQVHPRLGRGNCPSNQTAISSSTILLKIGYFTPLTPRNSEALKSQT